MKKITFLFLFVPFALFPQEYVDLFRINYGESVGNKFEGTSSNTTVTSMEAGFTIPVVLTSEHVLISGAEFSFNRLQLFPEAAATPLFSTTLKLGLASTWSEKWSTTLVLLPKLASDYKNIGRNDFYLGGIALLKLKKTPHFKYRFGAYITQEAFGMFTTPIIGWYYLSPNARFEMDMSLPIAADISYKFGKLALGTDYFGIGRSYNVHPAGSAALYADVSSLEFTAYLQANLLRESILLRTKIGYASNDYEMYTQDQTIDLGLSAFSFGDNRTQLNPSMKGGILFRVEAIYRFHIVPKSPSQTE